MARPKNENIQISVQCHPNVVNLVRSYARDESIKESKKPKKEK